MQGGKNSGGRVHRYTVVSSVTRARPDSNPCTDFLSRFLRCPFVREQSLDDMHEDRISVLSLLPGEMLVEKGDLLSSRRDYNCCFFPRDERINIYDENELRDQGSRLMLWELRIDFGRIIHG